MKYETHELPEKFSFYKEIGELEIDLITKALYQAQGIKARAAKLLGLKRTTLLEKMKKLGITTHFIIYDGSRKE